MFPVSLMFCGSAGFMTEQYALCLTLVFSVVTHRCAHMQEHSMWVLLLVITCRLHH